MTYSSRPIAILDLPSCRMEYLQVCYAPDCRVSMVRDALAIAYGFNLSCVWCVERNVEIRSRHTYNAPEHSSPSQHARFSAGRPPCWLVSTLVRFSGQLVNQSTEETLRRALVGCTWPDQRFFLARSEMAWRRLFASLSMPSGSVHQLFQQVETQLFEPRPNSFRSLSVIARIRMRDISALASLLVGR